MKLVKAQGSTSRGHVEYGIAVNGRYLGQVKFDQAFGLDFPKSQVQADVKKILGENRVSYSENSEANEYKNYPFAVIVEPTEDALLQLWGIHIEANGRIVGLTDVAPIKIDVSTTRAIQMKITDPAKKLWT